MLSWVQYAYGYFNGDVDSVGFWTVGPLFGPAVIVEVRSVISLNQFSNFELGVSIVSKSEASQANFDAGERLVRAPVETSVASTATVMSFSASGANPWTWELPTWHQFGVERRWVCFSADRTGGVANMRHWSAIRAERIWEKPGGPGGVGFGGSASSSSVLGILRERARRK